MGNRRKGFYRQRMREKSQQFFSGTLERITDTESDETPVIEGEYVELTADDIGDLDSRKLPDRRKETLKILVETRTSERRKRRSSIDVSI